MKLVEKVLQAKGLARVLFSFLPTAFGHCLFYDLSRFHTESSLGLRGIKIPLEERHWERRKLAGLE